MTYQIKLPEFEGPFDLLLFFIERDELDIYDIPIADITNDFLDYLKARKSLNLDVASEFILVAATLMKIKARMLLPRKDVDELGNEIDPRQELVERLLEYKKYKNILEELRQMEALRESQTERGNLINEIQQISNQAMADAELQNLSLFSLLKAYESVVFEFQYRTEKTIHTVVHYTYTIETSREHILDSFSIKDRLPFKQLFADCENRLHAIFIFLAILDLLQLEEISLINLDGANDFEIQRGFVAPSWDEEE